jgi:hypothetical protein
MMGNGSLRFYRPRRQSGGSREGPRAEIRPGEQQIADPASREHLSPAASRMRRSREGRRRGAAIVSLEIRPGVITVLVALGWLAESDHADRREIAEALADLVERALLVPATPCRDSQGRSSFVCDLPPTTVDTLVGLLWLPAERAGDRDEVLTAFRRFAGRALSVARRGALDLRNIRRSWVPPTRGHAAV